MDDRICRLALAIAATDLCDKDIEDVVRLLRGTGASVLKSLVAEARASVITKGSGQPKPRESRGIRSDASADVATRVKTLLRDEAQMGAKEAAKALLDLFRKDIPRNAITTTPGKEGFERWVRRLLSWIDEREVLRAATMLRNKRVHTPEPYWSIQ